MNRTDPLFSVLTLVSRGEADAWERDLFETHARTAIRYADPAAWITATAVARALAPIEEAVASVRHQVGFMLTSELGPTETIATVAEAARANLSSPLRYPAANPGSLVGVTCIAFGLRGPTLNLTMPPVQGVPVGLIAAAGWIQRQGTPFVLMATCFRDASQRRLARCLTLAGSDCSLPSAKPLQAADVAWICDRTEANELHR
jgi:hypothetical protein